MRSRTRRRSPPGWRRRWRAAERGVERAAGDRGQRVVVIGAGISGCAAAGALAGLGAEVLVLEAGRHLGGVAVAGEHRTLCGLAPIDAPTAELLEPGLVAAWLPYLADGGPS